NSTEPKSGPEPPINVEPPLRYVSVPAGYHLGLQHDLLALDIDCDTRKIPAVSRGVVKNCFGGALAQSESRGKICSLIAVERVFLPLPISVMGSALTFLALTLLVFYVQDRYVGLVQHALALVLDTAQLNPGA